GGRIRGEGGEGGGGASLVGELFFFFKQKTAYEMLLMSSPRSEGEEGQHRLYLAWSQVSVAGGRNEPRAHLLFPGPCHSPICFVANFPNHRPAICGRWRST